jgi:hypothetical protein
MVAGLRGIARNAVEALCGGELQRIRVVKCYSQDSHDCAYGIEKTIAQRELDRSDIRSGHVGG